MVCWKRLSIDTHDIFLTAPSISCRRTMSSRKSNLGIFDASIAILPSSKSCIWNSSSLSLDALKITWCFGNALSWSHESQWCRQFIYFALKIRSEFSDFYVWSYRNHIWSFKVHKKSVCTSKMPLYQDRLRTIYFVNLLSICLSNCVLVALLATLKDTELSQKDYIFTL